MNRIDAMKQAVEILNGSTLASDVDDAAIEVLREAIAIEEAQTVEPAEWQARIHDVDGWREWSPIVSDGRMTRDEILANYRIDIAAGFTNIELRPLFTRPAPATKQPLSTEREALIARKPKYNEGVVYSEQVAIWVNWANAAADMLAADAQRDDFNDAFSDGRQPWRPDAQQVAVPQEPIAHICILQTPDAGPTKFFTAPSDPRGFPVYAAPQPPQAERVAMTEAEIEAGREQRCSTGNPYCVTLKSWVKAIRFAEEHHGIGVKP